MTLKYSISKYKPSCSFINKQFVILFKYIFCSEKKTVALYSFFRLSESSS